MVIDKEIQLLIKHCKKALLKKPNEYVSSKLGQLIQLLEDPKLKGENLEVIAKISEELELYDHAGRFYHKYYDFEKTEWKKTQYDTRSDPYARELLASSFHDGELKKIDEMEKWLKFKRNNLNKYNYCGFHSHQLKNPITLIDGACPISHQKLKYPNNRSNPTKWTFQSKGECIAVNALLIEPVDYQDTPFEVFLGGTWTLPLQIANVTDQRFKFLTFELGERFEERFEAQTGVRLFEEVKTGEIVKLFDLDFIVEGGRCTLSQKGKGETAVSAIDPQQTYILEIPFTVKESELPPWQEEFKLASLLTVHYEDEEGNSLPSDECRPFAITIYLWVQNMYNILTDFLRVYQGDKGTPLKDILTRLEKKEGYRLSEKAFLTVLQSNKLIQYDYNETSKEITITKIKEKKEKISEPKRQGELERVEVQTTQPTPENQGVSPIESVEEQKLEEPKPSKSSKSIGSKQVQIEGKTGNCEKCGKNDILRRTDIDGSIQFLCEKCREGRLKLEEQIPLEQGEVSSGEQEEPILEEASKTEKKEISSRLKVFLSYCEKDFGVFQIEKICAMLNQKTEIEYVFYWDKDKNKKQYKSISDYENKAISESNFVLVFFHKETKDAPGVKKEIEIAKGIEGMNIIPIFMSSEADIWDKELREIIGVKFNKNNLDKFIDNIYLKLIS